LFSRAIQAGLKVGYAAGFGMAIGILSKELRGKRDALPDTTSGACAGAAVGWAFYVGKPISIIAQGTLGGAMLGFAIANQIQRNPELFGFCECRRISLHSALSIDDHDLDDDLEEKERLNRRVKFLHGEVDNLKWALR
jgi:hypothetical protein